MDLSLLEFFGQILLALILGGLIGLERERKRKAAGLQTYTLVCLGACLFVIISQQLFLGLEGTPEVRLDPSRIVAAVATGIGFIGAGVIIHKEFRVEGLTTAAGLWAVSAIGAAVGARLYLLALVAALFAIVVLFFFGILEQKIFNK
jgi:putative Mg2+ transporter-C (MgtC) family protein